jgi:phenylacetyl-CoA:acceptor oxidoreductase subunit 1
MRSPLNKARFMTHWAMVIDLKKCIACKTCIRVCTDVSNPPQGAAWRWSADHLLQIKPNESPVFFTLSCMHCENPSCLKVCPTSATYRRSDGIVAIDDSLCVGCGACIAACPYDARAITTIDTVAFNESGSKKNNNNTSDRIGICTKCDFCHQRIDDGIKKGLAPGVDDEATPNCVRYCIAEALHFGDLDDPDSNVSNLIKDRRNFTLREDLNNVPSVYYLY